VEKKVSLYDFLVVARGEQAVTIVTRGEQAVTIVTSANIDVSPNSMLI
jgi:hypothetical protein